MNTYEIVISETEYSLYRVKALNFTQAIESDEDTWEFIDKIDSRCDRDFDSVTKIVEGK